MKVYNVVGVYACENEQRYVNGQNIYYVYDKMDNSIELWFGTELLKIRQECEITLAHTVLWRGMFVVLNNELIMVDDSKHRYIWYNGVGLVDKSDTTSFLESLDPLKLSYTSPSVEIYQCSFGEIMKRLTMEVV